MYGGFIRRVFYKAFTLRIKPRLYFCVIELPAVIDLISCSKEGGCRAVEACGMRRIKAAASIVVGKRSVNL